MAIIILNEIIRYLNFKRMPLIKIIMERGESVNDELVPGLK